MMPAQVQCRSVYTSGKDPIQVHDATLWDERKVIISFIGEFRE